MNSFRTTWVSAGLVAMLAIVCIAVTGTASAGQEEAKKPAVQTAPHGAYAGTDTCLTCHEDRAASIKQGAHSQAFRAGTPMSPKGCQACHADTKAAMGCEGCHGPGKEHADAGGDKTKISTLGSLSPKDASQTCVSCHFRTAHTFWAAASTTSAASAAPRATASTRRRARSSSRRPMRPPCARSATRRS